MKRLFWFSRKRPFPRYGHTLCSAWGLLLTILARLLQRSIEELCCFVVEYGFCWNVSHETLWQFFKMIHHLRHFHSWQSRARLSRHKYFVKPSAMIAYPGDYLYVGQRSFATLRMTKPLAVILSVAKDLWRAFVQPTCLTVCTMEETRSIG